MASERLLQAPIAVPASSAAAASSSSRPSISRDIEFEEMRRELEELRAAQASADTAPSAPPLPSSSVSDVLINV